MTNVPENISTAKQAVTLGGAGRAYGKLSLADRQPYLDKAKQMAAVSLPYECPPDEGTGMEQSFHHKRQLLPVPANGLVPQGVKTLASKMVTTLFPTNVPYFRFTVSEAVLNEADELEKEVGAGPEVDPESGQMVQAGGSFRSEIQQKMLSMEKIVTQRTETYSHRKTLYALEKKLIITGNCLLRFLDDGSIRIHNLGSYVVERDYSGNPFRIILKEMKLVALLDETTREKVLSANADIDTNDADAEATLYTYWGKQAEGKLWETWQEVSDTGIILPDSYGTMKFEDIPVMAERWISIDGENYGRGLLEEHESDVLDLESLSVDVKEASKAFARVIPLINPNGITDAMDLAEAENLEYVEGVESDVTVLSLAQNVRDYQAAQLMRQEIIQRLQQVFLMLQSVQRDAERVTAEEIRFMVGELNTTHGGVYTVQADELQRPYVNRMVQQAIREGDLDKDVFADGQIKPEVITGLDALGRGQDTDSLRELFAMIRENEGAREFNMTELWTRYLVAKGIELDGLLKTPQDKVDEQKQLQNMQRQNTKEGVGAEMAVNEHKAGLEPPPPTQ